MSSASRMAVADGHLFSRSTSSAQSMTSATDPAVQESVSEPKGSYAQRSA